MTVLSTSIDRRSEPFVANAAAMRALVADLRAKVAAIETGGTECEPRHTELGDPVRLNEPRIPLARQTEALQGAGQR